MIYMRAQVCVCVSRVRVLYRRVEVFLVYSLPRTAHILCWTVRANKTPVITCHNVIDAIYRIQRVVRLHNMCSDAVSHFQSYTFFIYNPIKILVNNLIYSRIKRESKALDRTIRKRSKTSKVAKNLNKQAIQYAHTHTHNCDKTAKLFVFSTMSILTLLMNVPVSWNAVVFVSLYTKFISWLNMIKMK